MRKEKCREQAQEFAVCIRQDNKIYTSSFNVSVFLNLVSNGNNSMRETGSGNLDIQRNNFLCLKWCLTLRVELRDKQMSKRGQTSYTAKNFVTNYFGY